MLARSLVSDTRALCALMLCALVCAVFAFPMRATAQLSQEIFDDVGTATIVPGQDGNELANDPVLSQNGLLGCLGAGAVAANQGNQILNVGTLRATGGVFVPVNDAAVTLNTGFLVYKECILDGMARAIAQNISAEHVNSQIREFNTGRFGAPQFSQNLTLEVRAAVPGILSATLSNEALGPMCGAFRTDVQRIVTRSTLIGLNSPGSIYACPFTGGGFYSDWFARTSPTGNLFGIAAIASGVLASNISQHDRDYREQVLAGQGIIPRFDRNIADGTSNPLLARVVTPAALVASAITQAMGSGFRQLENANEVDQIVSNLFAGLTSRLLGSVSGVPGLIVTTGTQPAFVDRMTAQTQQVVRITAINAAALTLNQSQQNESAYLAAKQGTAQAFLNAIINLRSYESQCWNNMIIPAVQEHAAANGNPTLVIATSTQFSQAVIDSPTNNIRALASTTAGEVLASQQTLQQLNQLITTMSSGTSTTAQQQALLTFDQMLAQNRIHTALQAQDAAEQRGAVTGALTTLLNDTRIAWADSQDANIGWCNINNTAVVERWFNAWRQ